MNIDVLENWPIPVNSVKHIGGSVWLLNEEYILKTGDNLQILGRNISAVQALSKLGVPVSEIVKTKSGKNYELFGANFYLLSKRLPGSHIESIFREKPEFSTYLGEITGRLHMAFQKCEEELVCYNNAFCDEINGWVIDSFCVNKIDLIPGETLRRYTDELNERYPQLPRQLIHRDLHLGNLLFENGRLSGYIDFDLCQINARIFDLCYLALGFLSRQEITPEISNNWFTILASLVKGYETLIPLSCEEKAAFPCVMAAIEYLFIAYYANHQNSDQMKKAAAIAGFVTDNRSRIESVLP